MAQLFRCFRADGGQRGGRLRRALGQPAGLLSHCFGAAHEVFGRADRGEVGGEAAGHEQSLLATAVVPRHPHEARQVLEFFPQRSR